MDLLFLSTGYAVLPLIHRLRGPPSPQGEGFFISAAAAVDFISPLYRVCGATPHPPLARSPFPSRGRLFYIRSGSCRFHFASLPGMRCYPSSVSLRLTPSPQGEGFFISAPIALLLFYLNYDIFRYSVWKVPGTAARIKSPA